MQKALVTFVVLLIFALLFVLLADGSAVSMNDPLLNINPLPPEDVFEEPKPEPEEPEPEPEPAPAVPVAPGSACNTYIDSDQREQTCPEHLEFDATERTCVPISESGCTARLHPFAPDLSEFNCTGGWGFYRHPLRPCEWLVQCNPVQGVQQASEGFCFQQHKDTNVFVSVRCAEVAGCREHDLNFIDIDAPFDLETVACTKETVGRSYRNAAQPCLSHFTCVAPSYQTRTLCPNCTTGRACQSGCRVARCAHLGRPTPMEEYARNVTRIKYL
jgi:hypothetical protein